MVVLHGNGRVLNYGDNLLMMIFQMWAEKELGPDSVRWLFINTEVAKMTGLQGCGLQELVKSDAVIYCGGGYFTQPPKGLLKWTIRNSIYYTLPVLFSNYVRRKRLAIFGVGIGDCNAFYSCQVRKIVDLCDKVVVRDVESLQVVQHWIGNSQKVEQLTDAALAIKGVFPTEPIREGITDQQRIIIHISKERFSDVDIVAAVENVIRYLDSKKYQIVLITDTKAPTPNEQDRIVAKLSETSNELHIHKYESVSQLTNIIMDSDIVITTKLHVGIVGSIYGKCVISIPCHSKIPRFYDHIGWAEACFDFSSETTLQEWLLMKIDLATPIAIPETITCAVDLLESGFRDYVKTIGRSKC